jgi:maltooligosyltrehalose synthase
LLRRYITDFIAQMQQLSAPVHTRLREDTNFVPTGAGAYFAVRLDGNEVGGGWRALDDNSIPSGGNERVKQARVAPKKY